MKLSSIVTSSNACEACLRLIAGLEIAAKELDEELDALEDEDVQRGTEERMSIDIDDNNVLKILSQRHVEFLDKLKGHKRPPDD
ncbi:hypothetical protein BG003_009340 [Podila horticola]|nr:hypothetical protein BG003_009340 [Podila horticola]